MSSESDCQIILANLYNYMLKRLIFLDSLSLIYHLLILTLMISVLVFLEDEDPVEKIPGSVAHASEGITVRIFGIFPKQNNNKKIIYTAPSKVFFGESPYKTIFLKETNV